MIEDDWLHTKSCIRVADGTVEEARATVKMTAKVASEALALLDQQTQYLCAMGHYLFDEDQNNNNNDNDDNDNDNDENGADQNNGGEGNGQDNAEDHEKDDAENDDDDTSSECEDDTKVPGVDSCKCKGFATTNTEREFESDDDDMHLAQLVGAKAVPVDPELFFILMKA